MTPVKPRNVARPRGIGWHVSAMFMLRSLAVILNAAFYVVAARTLGTSDFGDAVAVVGATAFASVVVDAGTSGRVSRDAARDAAPASLSAALVWRAWGCLASLGIVAATALLVPALGLSHRLVFLVAVIVAWTWLLTVQNLLASLLVGLGRTIAGGGVKLVERIVALLLFGTFAANHDADPVRFWLSSLGGVAASCIVGAVLALPALVRAWWDPSRARSARQAISIGFLSTGLGAQLQNLDVALMSWVGGNRAAGLLAAPSRVTTPLGLLAASSAEIFLVQARHLRTSSARASRRRVAGAVFALTTLGVSPILIVPDTTVRLLFGNQYEGSASVFRLMAIGVCISSLNQPLAATLLARYRQRLVGASVMAGGIVDLAVVAALGPSRGAIAGGVGVVASQITILVLLVGGRGGIRKQSEEAVALVPPH